MNPRSEERAASSFSHLPLIPLIPLIPRVSQERLGRFAAIATVAFLVVELITTVAAAEMAIATETVIAPDTPIATDTPNAPATSSAPEPTVLVTSNSAIHRFRADGTRLPDLVSPGHESLDAPQYLALGPDGLLYIAQFGLSGRPGSIEVFDPAEGRHVRTALACEPERGEHSPAWLGFDEDRLIVSYIGSHRVRTYRVADDGTLVPDPGDYLRRSNAPLRAPHTIHAFPDGRRLLTERGRVSWFDANGEFAGDLLPRGIARPLGVLALDDGSLLVSDFQRVPVVVDVAKRQIVRPFARLASTDRADSAPTDAAAPDPPAGANAAAAGAGSDGLLRLPDARVWVAYNASRSIREYRQDGTLLREIAGPESDLGRVNAFLLLPTPRLESPAEASDDR